MSSEIVDFFQQRKLSLDLVRKLRAEFLTFSAVLADAEDLQDIKPDVKEWLDMLKDVVYDAEDILDKIATEALRSELDAEFLTPASKVRKSISGFRNSYVKEIEPEINRVLKTLEFLKDEINVLGLREGLGSRTLERLPTSSLVDESSICGRDDDKLALVNGLLSDDACNKEMGVLAIVGMGGVGKTTLARLVYNDERVRGHFDCFAWVCVSDKFDLVMITKKLLESLKTQTFDSQNLDVLQNTLKQSVEGKKFLFVLDDDWNKNYAAWDELMKPFKYGKQGSKIIITTREDDVASVMHASLIHRPKTLREKDGLSLLAKFAFGDQNLGENQPLEELGKKIVKKCGGLPLAIKTIGALLRSKLDIDYWTTILNSELWGETEILSTLQISYKYLPSHLKQCFAYCSIFPKDYVFKKEKLILLWMAEGLLFESKNKTMEQVGNDYFMALVSRSLFEISSGDEYGNFIMHDLVNDLATSVSMQFTLRLEGDYSRHIMYRVRHMSYVMGEDDGFKKFEFLYKATKLRTFLPLVLSREIGLWLTKKVQLELLPMLKCLRVLSLSRYWNINELSNSICEFKHLRFLDLSYTGVKKLPDSICLLCNLQTLDISHCCNLVTLPKEMWKLVNLRHLILMATNIVEMPMQFSRLKSLQTLSKFIINKYSGSSIGELRMLTNLQGSLHIAKLQNIESPIDASLRSRKYLQELRLEWNSGVGILERERSVLDALQPHKNLRKLAICGYRGKSFSDWIGHPSFSNLATVQLDDCKHCKSLPPLGQLCSLQSLSIGGFDEVVLVGPEFYGSSSPSHNPFKALKILSFKHMAKWEEWVSFVAENRGGAFPQLEHLTIDNCPKLVRGLPVHPSLTKLEIYRCPQLMAPLPRRTRHLELEKCNQALPKDLPTGVETIKIMKLDALESLSKGGLPSTLKSLEIFSCEKLKSLSEGMSDSNIYLEVLAILNCPSFMSFPKGGLPSTLKYLEIFYCEKLKSLPEGMRKSNICLEVLFISNCPSFVSLPKAGLPLTLKTLRIEECAKIECFPRGIFNSNRHLQNLMVYGCSSLMPLPKGCLPSAIKFFHIRDYNKLESLPEGMVDSNIKLEELSIWSCSSLMSLPKDGLPSSLKFLEIWDCMKLELPTHPYYSALENLRLESCDSLKSFPLDLFPKLYQIKIRNCCNLRSLTLPQDYDHHLVASHLSIISCPEFVSLPNGGLHAPGLTILKFKHCGSLRSLPEKMHKLLTSLERLSIRHCPKLESFPEGGLPCNLKSLTIDYKLFASQTGSGLQNLFFLRRLHISGNCQDMESFSKKLLLPTTLTSLRVSFFRNLKSLYKMGLQQLSILERLQISELPKLKYMPKQGLPTSLSTLEIYHCPLLKKQWQSREGKEWRKIAHVKYLWVDHEFIG